MSSNLPKDFETSPEIIDILGQINQHIDTLAQQVEDNDPGNIFGLPKAQHCKELSQEAYNIGSSAGLEDREIELLQIIFLSHDIGRFREVLDDKDTLRPGIRHGVLSADSLKTSGILNSLNQEEQETIYKAIKFHSERSVDLDEKSLAYKLCYILRDADKGEVIGSVKFLEAEGVLGQLEKHYKINIKSNNSEKYLSIIRKLLNNKKVSLDEGDEEREKIIEILNKGIYPNSLDEFSQRFTTTIQDIGYSYATYMLNSLSLIFDFSNPKLIIEAIQDPMYKKRLDFIQTRVDSATYNTIISTIRSYIEEKCNNLPNISNIVSDILHTNAQNN